MPQDLGDQPLVGGVVDATQSPELAAAGVADAARAVILTGQEDPSRVTRRTAGGNCRGIDRGARLDLVGRIAGVDPGKLGPDAAAGRPRIRQPEKLGIQAVPGEFQSQWPIIAGEAAEPCKLRPAELHGKESAERRCPRVVEPGFHMDATGHQHEPA